MTTDPVDIKTGEVLQPREPGVCPVCGQTAFADLVAALGELDEPKKSGKAVIPGRPAYAYLELPDLLTAVRSSLVKHHLAVMQEVTNAERDVTVTTVILHASGYAFRSQPLVLRSGGSAQDIGSASTYGRRYSLAAMVGLAGDVDDDGAKATKPEPSTKPPQPPQLGEDPHHIHHIRKASLATIRMLWALLRQSFDDEPAARTWVATQLGLESTDWHTNDLTQEQAGNLITRLQAEQGEPSTLPLGSDTTDGPD